MFWKEQAEKYYNDYVVAKETPAANGVMDTTSTSAITDDSIPW